MIKAYASLILAMMGAANLPAQKGQPAAAPFDSALYYNNTKKPAISDAALTEYAPTIQADGKTIIFEASAPGKNVYKLYQTSLTESKSWGPRMPLDRINNTGDSLDLIGGPSLSFDGNLLYFFRTVGTNANHEIFVSRRTRQGWSEPEPLGPPINTAGYEAFPSISADGATLYFVRQNTAPQSKEIRKLEQFCFSIYRSVRNKEGNWGPPERLPWPINQDCEKAPKIMADGKTLIFSSNRPGGKGGFDMYQTKLNDLGEWTPPVPLDFVNTELDDQLPCIAAEGDLMYYTYNNSDIYSIVIPFHLRQFMNNVVQGFITDMDTKGGIGAEIVVTDALTSEVVMTLDNNPDDGRYTVVLPVGRSFNIEFRKEGYSSFAYRLDLRTEKKYRQIDRNVALFKSIKLNLTVNDTELFEPLAAEVRVKEVGAASYLRETKTNPATGRVNLDLPIGKNYEISISAPFFKGYILPFSASGLVMYREFEKYAELNPEKKEIFVNVTDTKNNSKIKSKVVIKNKSRNEVIEVEGNQNISLRAGDRYEVEVTSEQGYAFNSTSIDLTSGAFSGDLTIGLLHLEPGANLPLKDINFESNSAQLSDISFIELKRVVEMMRENPTLKVEIAAHTDDIGSEAYNLALSHKRAKSVVDYLIENKIPPERFLPKGYGETVAKVPNNSEENRAVNRRVELKVLSI
jgi:outer membrane protein OmpA-like peptidoglycan-associated protein